MSLAEFYDVHWKEPGAYDNRESDQFQLELFRGMFPDFERKVKYYATNGAIILDVGCGSGIAGLTYFKDVLDRIEYIGVDLSQVALDQAKAAFAARNVNARFLNEDYHSLDFGDRKFDVVFCPGVLHYAQDLRKAVESLTRVLKIGGRFVTWIYKQQKPIRRLTDAYIRAAVSSLPAKHALDDIIEPLTKLGIALGRIDEKLIIWQDIPLLEIKAGTYSVQEFFYYHVVKLFYNSKLPYKRHLINNLNAYAPKHVLFLPESEIMQIFVDLGYALETWNAQGNGIGIVATNTGGDERSLTLSYP